MLRRVGLFLVLSACGVTDPLRLRPVTTLEGAITVPPGITGDAWLFLFEPGSGPPSEPGLPVSVTAVGAARLEANRRYVFGEVQANPWRLWGFLDVDQSFRGDVDVLAQPTAGDRLAEARELELQPRERSTADVTFDALVRFEPPAFVVENSLTEVFALDADGVTPTVLNLAADRLGRFDPTKTGFSIGLLDADDDGRADDLDGDRVPDLTFTAFLRWLPRPGQHPEGTDVVVPLVLNPAPLLAQLGGDVRTRLLVDRLSLVVVPQAQEVLRKPGRRELRPFGAAPVGDYELIVLQGGGQFWRVPNGLAAALPSQALRFRFERR